MKYDKQDKLMVASLCISGLLAAETDEHGFTETYETPDGKETYRKEQHPFREDGKTENYSAEKRPNKLLRTAAQNRARAAVENADALLAALEAQ